MTCQYIYIYSGGTFGSLNFSPKISQKFWLYSTIKQKYPNSIIETSRVSKVYIRKILIMLLLLNIVISVSQLIYWDILLWPNFIRKTLIILLFRYVNCVIIYHNSASNFFMVSYFAISCLLNFKNFHLLL